MTSGKSHTAEDWHFTTTSHFCPSQCTQGIQNKVNSLNENIQPGKGDE